MTLKILFSITGHKTWTCKVNTHVHFVTMVIICLIIPSIKLCAQVDCNRVSVYDSLLLGPNGYPTNVCSGDTLSIGMATVRSYYHVINGPVGGVKEGAGGEGNGGSISFESSANAKNAGVYYAKVTKQGCPTLSSNTVVINYKGPKERKLTGGGFYCPGSTGGILQIDSSETNSTYQLFRAGSNPGDVPVALSGLIAGTGAAISFPTVPITGNYFIKATNTQCSLNFGNEKIYNSPLGLQITSQTANSVNFEWATLPGVIGYRYAVSTSATPPGSGTTVTAGNTAAVTGLFSSTQYYIHVSAQCSVGLYGEWTSMSFYTEAGCDIPPVLTLCNPITASFSSGEGKWNFDGIFPSNSAGKPTLGKEAVYSFTPVTTGYYYLQVTQANSNSKIDYLFKNAATGCSNVGWTGIGTFSGNGAGVLGQLQAGVQYLIMADKENIYSSCTQTFRICIAETPDCSGGQVISLCQPVTAIMPSGYGAWDLGAGNPATSTIGKEKLYNFTPPTTGNYYIEAISGNGSMSFSFKTASAGCNNNNWTKFGILSNGEVSIPQTFQGGQTYYILVDNSSDTTITKSFKICKADTPPCPVVSVLTSCSPFSATIPTGVGGWDFADIHPANYAGYATPGKELIYAFTPPVSGFYYMEMISAGDGYIDYLYKQASIGCNNLGWTGIGRFNKYDTGVLHQKEIGQLEAGVQYYLLLDNESVYNSGTQLFKICKAAEPDCLQSQSINSCDLVSASISPGLGAWSFNGVFPNNSVGHPTPGKEVLYKFNPATTGYYYIDVISSSGSDIDFLFKPAILGCTGIDWKGINRYSSGSTKHILIGQLQAATNYYFLLDSENPEFQTNIIFKICQTDNLSDCATSTNINVCSDVNVNIPSGNGVWDFSGNFPDNTAGNSSPGKEVKYRFTPPVTGNYEFQLVTGDGNSTVSYLYKADSTGCNDVGWTGIGVFYSPAERKMGRLQAGVQYFILADNSYGSANQTFRICPLAEPDCNQAVVLNTCVEVTSNIASGNGAWDLTGAGKEKLFVFTPSSTGNYYIEITSTSNPYDVEYRYKPVSPSCSDTGWNSIGSFYYGGAKKTIGQLNSGVAYYILADNQGTFSATSQTFRICKIEPQNCSLATTVNLCEFLTFNIPGGEGTWDFAGNYPVNSAGYTTFGKEKLFIFTPTITDNYYLEITSGESSYIDYLFKPVSSGCNDTGWTGIGHYSYDGSKLIGKLNAGVSYYIVADKEDNYSSITQTFRICEAENTPNCSIAPTVVLCQPTLVNIAGGTGSWELKVQDPFGSGSTVTPGKEQLYKFTPAVPGDYFLNVTSGDNTIAHLYKPISAACNDTGWKSIGNYYYETSKFIGTLTANTPYYIIADNTTSLPASQTFTICKSAPAPDCASATPVSECVPVTDTLKSGNGGWNFNENSLGYPTPGTEKLYSFTPVHTGDYDLEITGAIGEYAHYFYKVASGGCVDTGWTDIGRFSEYETGKKTLYRLQGGVKYYLLMDNESALTQVVQTFRICKLNISDCPTMGAIDLCTEISAYIDAGIGELNLTGVVPDDTASFSTPGKELIYNFIPAVSGFYYLEVTGSYGGNNSKPVDYYYKKSVNGCADTGWNLISRSFIDDTENRHPIGELESGQGYLILLDHEDLEYKQPQFKICKSDPLDSTSIQTISACAEVTADIAEGFGVWDFSGHYPYNSVDSKTPGKEKIYRFNAPVSGFYYLEIISASYYTPFDYLFKRAAGGFNNTGWTGIGQVGSAGFINIGYLEAGVDYYILLDRETTISAGSQTFKICRATPPDCSSSQALVLCSPITASIPIGFGAWDFSKNSQNNSSGYPTPGKELMYSFTAPETGIYYLEVQSVNGNNYIDYLYKAVSNNCVDTGWKRIGEFKNTGGKNFGLLQGGTQYYLLLDNENPSNAVEQTFLICKANPPDCSAAQTIGTCTPVNININGGTGGWDFEGTYPNNSVGYSTTGKEAVFLFTPAISGMYSIEVTSAVGSTVDYLYKKVTNGCIDTGWTGIGRFNNNGGKNIGPLQAGIQYFIIADKEGSTSVATSQTFKICQVSLPDCLNTTRVFLSIPVTSTIQAGIGGWELENVNIINSNSISTPGREKIFSYTPLTSGFNFLETISSNSLVSYFYKPASLGCGNEGWISINALTEGSFGPLQSGMEYYILADNNGINENTFEFVITGERVICPGDTTIFTVTPQDDIPGVNPFFYYWQADNGSGFVNISDNAYYADTRSTNLMIYNAPSFLNGTKYRCVAQRTGFAPSIKFSAYKTIRFSNTWTGTQSSNWNLPGNWSCGKIPDDGTDVIIPAGTPFAPIVNGNFSCKSVSVRNGAVITIGNGFKLDVKGK